MALIASEFQVVNESFFYWSYYDPDLKCELVCTALNLQGGLVIIDPLPLAERARNVLLSLGPLRAILITNGNHVRDTLAWREEFHVPVVTAPATRRDITELRPDVALLPNELLYGLAAIPIPGATVGETAFFAAREGILVIGDAVTNLDPETGLAFLPDKYCTDPEQSRESLRTLLDLDFDTLSCAHGAPISPYGKAYLAALLGVPEYISE